METNKITIIIMDIDGTMTDGKIYMGYEGELFKVFDVKDGYAILHILPKLGIKPVVITGRKSEIVLRRCEELGITEVYQACTDKKNKMIEVVTKLGGTIQADGTIKGVAYIGDDILDIPCMEIADISACPSDAVVQARECADYVCESKGGDGAVREFIEWIYKKYYQI